MMTPWGRIGGSQENVRDLGPLAVTTKFAGGVPGARQGSQCKHKYMIYKHKPSSLLQRTQKIEKVKKRMRFLLLATVSNHHMLFMMPLVHTAKS